MIQQMDKIGLHYFRQAMHGRIELLETRYREKYQGEMSDENITRFISENKEGIHAAIEVLRKELIGDDVPNDVQTEIDKAVHYFWAEVVERLRGLGNETDLYAPNPKPF